MQKVQEIELCQSQDTQVDATSMTNVNLKRIFQQPAVHGQEAGLRGDDFPGMEYV